MLKRRGGKSCKLKWVDNEDHKESRKGDFFVRHYKLPIVRLIFGTTFKPYFCGKPDTICFLNVFC